MNWSLSVSSCNKKFTSEMNYLSEFSTHMVYFSHSHVCVKCRKGARNFFFFFFFFGGGGGGGGGGCALIKAFWTVSQWVNLGVSNRTKSNKNPIELNRTIGVRLASAIEQNRTSILL